MRELIGNVLITIYFIFVAIVIIYKIKESMKEQAGLNKECQSLLKKKKEQFENWDMLEKTRIELEKEWDNLDKQTYRRKRK